MKVLIIDDCSECPFAQYYIEDKVTCYYKDSDYGIILNYPSPNKSCPLYPVKEFECDEEECLIVLDNK